MLRRMREPSASARARIASGCGELVAYCSVEGAAHSARRPARGPVGGRVGVGSGSESVSGPGAGRVSGPTRIFSMNLAKPPPIQMVLAFGRALGFGRALDFGTPRATVVTDPKMGHALCNRRSSGIRPLPSGIQCGLDLRRSPGGGDLPPGRSHWTRYLPKKSRHGNSIWHVRYSSSTGVCYKSTV